MELTLSPETSRMVEQKLKDGPYQSADELLQAAMHALDEQECEELDKETLDAIDEAEEDIRQGRVHRWKDVRDQVRELFTPEK